MIIGSTWQLKQLNIDDFLINCKDTHLEVVEKAKYFGMSINSDITWDFHNQTLCKQMYYLLSLLRRLRAIFPPNILLQVYKSYIQPKLDYGLIIFGCRTQNNLTLGQRLGQLSNIKYQVLLYCRVLAFNCPYVVFYS